MADAATKPRPILTPERRASVLSAWADFYDGSSARATDELDEYEARVTSLMERGGSVYRVIFADHQDEVLSADYGAHWTVDRHHIDMFVDALWSHYGAGKKQAFVVEAVLPPGAVSADHVDLAGNPHEKEVGIVPSRVIHYRHYLYNSKALIPIENPSLAQLSEPVRSTHIAVDGDIKPSRRSDGLPIAHSLEATIEFWRAFGESKVVDRLGRPVVVFHGTDQDFEEFRPSARGSFGSGIYFADAEGAEAYSKYTDGSRLIPAFLSLQNPLVCEADHDAGYDEAVDLDSAAVPLIRRVYGDMAMAEIEKARESDAYFGEDLQRAIEAMGHDGLILNYPDGSQEYVAFSSSQVVSSLSPAAAFRAIKRAGPLPGTIEVDGVLRPTTNSQGAPIYPTESGIVNFWRWFGHSKSVDASGRPLQLFHGTTADFSAFDKDAIGNNFGLDKDGFFFTNNPVTAAHFADPEAAFVAAGMQPHRDIREGAKILPVYVSLTNPLTIDEYLWAYDTTVAYELDRNGISAIDYFDDNRASIMDMAKRYGRDGVIFEHANTSLYVALEPTQVKSSIGNAGSFSNSKPRIFNQPNYNAAAMPQAAADAASRLSPEELAKKHDDLEARVDAAFEAGEIDLAEELDAELAALRELEPGDIDNDEYEQFSLDDALSLTYAQVFAPSGVGVFIDRDSAIANMRENIHLYGGKDMQDDITDEQIVEAAREAYERKLARIQAIRNNPSEFAYPSPPGKPIGETINVDGVMRPTMNSEDQLIHPTKAGIRNFWRWFGNSEAVDGEQRPMVYYHGTSRAPHGIEVFDTAPTTELGAHFGTPDQAGQFVWDEKGVMQPVYIKTDNLLRLSDLGDFTIDFVGPQLDALNIPEPASNNGESLMEGDYLRARIQQAGYDGVIYLNRREGAHDPFGPDGVDGDELNEMTDEEVMELFPDAEDSIVVFDPSQIKSALGNSGAFSPQKKTILHQPAYHGTPHLFSEFSLAHVGNGEGHQAFGWGLYFTESESIAAHYRDTTSRWVVNTSQGKINKGDLVEVLLGGLESPPSLESALRSTANQLVIDITEKGIPYAVAAENLRSSRYGHIYIDLADAVDRLQPAVPEGQVYKVDIPEDDTFLLWDKPWGDQSEAVKTALSSLTFGDYFQTWMRDPDVTGRDIYEQVGAAIHPGSGKNVWQEPASRHLAALGINGIKYLDGMSRQDGAGTFNYVVFDDSAIRTIERNGQPIKATNTNPIDTPEFKQWFGSSKVTSPDGSPLVVYHHGSFDANTDTPSCPMHFGTRQAATERAFGKALDDAAMGVEAYQNEQGIWHWDDNQGTTSEDLELPGFAEEATAIDYGRSSIIRQMNESAMDGPDEDDLGNTTAVFLSLQNPKRLPDLHGANGEWGPAIEQARAEGFDGIVYRNQYEDKGRDSYIAFYPSQIKSATQNSGAFNQSNPSILHQAAYHGTPHEFTKFSLDHVGKGEGAAAYGYGIYFTDTQAVADSYRRTLSRGAPSVMMNGRRLVGTVLNTAVFSLAEKLDAITREDVRRYLVDSLVDAQASTQPYAKALVKELRAGLKRLDASKSFEVSLGPEHGNLIKAEIPDSGYLMWDAPIVDQPPAVLEALAKSRRQDIKDLLTRAAFPASHGDLPDGAHLYSVLSLNMSGRRASKEASQYLLKLGIPGIKYLDGMSRDLKEGGSYNYVVFDDGSIRVVERNGAPVDAVGARAPVLHRPAHEGSSYVFAQHSLNHIGRGEQAMPFGWGVYFNDSQAIQEFYDLNLSSAPAWDTETAAMIALRFAEDYPEALSHTGLDTAALSAANSVLATAINNWAAPAFIQWASDLATIAPAPAPAIPDTSSFLLWDEPLHAQPQLIKRVARTLDIAEPNVTGRDIYARVGETPEGASKCLAAMGVEGIRYENPAGGFVVFTPPLIEALEDVSAGLVSPVAANAAQVTMTRVPGGAEYEVGLFKDANESSFLHEAGHIFLDVYEAASMQPGCSKVIRRDMAILRDWMGLPPGSPITEEGHEKFARATEHYARTAKAPTSALQGVFDSFKGWLGRIHDRLKGRADFSMSEEVKGVLDRMFGHDLDPARIDAAPVALPGERLAEEASLATPDASRSMHESHAATGAIVDHFLKVFAARGLAEECMAEQITITVAHQRPVVPVMPASVPDSAPVTDDLLEVDVDGVMRPTRNSLDRPIHQDVGGVRNFWRWFGSSAIVDQENRPRVMFHGSVNKGVSEFDVDIEPVRARSGPNGVYFTSNPDVACGYTRRLGVKGQRGEVIPMYLRIEEPLHTAAAIKKLQKKGVKFNEAKAAALSALDTLKHDGVVFTGSSVNHDEYIVLNPWQMKSAAKNNGEFHSESKNIYNQPAYHGSPYKFDAFCTQHMGRGEGAQAYGAGLYFAQNPEVADWYRKQLSLTKLVLKESMFNTNPGRQEREIIQTINEVFRGSLKSRGIDAASVRPFSNLRDFYNAAHDSYLKKKDEQHYRDNKDEIDKKIQEFGAKYDASEEYRSLVHEISGKQEKPDYDHFKHPHWSSYRGALDVVDALLTKRGLTGTIYKVDLPADNVMLHWDLPLSQQPEPVKSAILSLRGELRDLVTATNIVGAEPTGAAIYTAIKEYFSGSRVNDAFTNHASFGAQEASDELRFAGIKGIKYLDGFSRNAGEGSYNYVVFDGADVSIVHSHHNAARLHETTGAPSATPAISTRFRERLSAVSALAEQPSASSPSRSYAPGM